MNSPREPVAPSPGALRLEQAAVAVILLGGFVFKVWYVLPVVALLLLAPVLGGEQANVFARIHDAIVSPDAATAPRPVEPAMTTRATRVVEIVLLAIGTLMAVVGLRPVAWFFALVVAAITAIAATTGINVVARLRDRRGH